MFMPKSGPAAQLQRTSSAMSVHTDRGSGGFRVMTRNKILAILGAGVLMLGVVGVALAEELNTGQVGSTLSSFGNDCEEFPLEVGPGQIGVHFVLTTPDNGATSAVLNATFSTDTIVDLANTQHPSTTLHFYAVITGDGDTTIDSASTDVNGGNL